MCTFHLQVRPFCDCFPTNFFQTHELAWCGWQGCLSGEAILPQVGHGIRLHRQEVEVLAVLGVHYLQDVFPTFAGRHVKILVVVARQRFNFGRRQPEEPLHSLSHLRLTEIGLGIRRWHCYYKIKNKNQQTFIQQHWLKVMILNRRLVAWVSFWETS